MDMVHARFAQSLATLNRPEGAIFCFSIGSSVHMSREAIAKEAIRIGADYALWLDSDMVFAPDALERLLATEKDLIGGFYLKREPPYTPVVYASLRPNAVPYSNYGTEIFEVDGIGFGCMLTKVSILEDILQHYGTIFNPIDNYGEDLSFCIRAADLNYEIYCDPTIDISHIGQIVTNKQILHS